MAFVSYKLNSAIERGTKPDAWTGSGQALCSEAAERIG